MSFLKVLVVDNDIHTLELMRETLTSFGVTVQALDNGQDAKALIDREKFDGAFVELLTPQLDGIELIRAIRGSKSNRRIPVVVVTGSEQRDALGRSFEAGATFILHKPVDQEKLSSLYKQTRGFMLEERRRYIRIPVQMDVMCEMSGRRFRATALNLSQSGILLKVEANPLSAGKALGLLFTLPGQSVTINVRGSVVYVREEKLSGIQFLELSSDAKQRLRDFVVSTAAVI